MADITGMIERLVAAGADPVVAACVVAEAVIAGHETTAYRGDEAAERRREKDRARKAAEREAKRASADNPQKSADSADAADATVSLSPVPPSFPPHPPNNPLTPKPIQTNNSARGSRLPADWTLCEADLAYALGKGLSKAEARGLFERFCSWAWSAGGSNALKRNWHQAWQGWVQRDAPKILAGRAREGPPQGKGGFVTVLMDKHLERQHGTGNLDADDDERGASGGFADRARIGR